MSKHTPGPWTWDGNPCDYDKEQEAPWLVQDIYHRGIPILTGEITCESAEDARLIAAAPELLEALRLFVGDNRTHTEGERLAVARAAIAKATEVKP